MPAEGMRLGLDLQGGLYLILKVNLPRAIENHLDLAVSDLRDALRQIGITARAQTVGNNHVRLLFNEAPAEQEKVRQIISSDFPSLTILPENTNAPSGSIDLGLKTNEIQSIQKNAMTQSVEIIRNRVDQFGIVEPVILRQGQDQIAVQLPGLKDPSRAVDLIGRTAQLEFKLVDSAANVNLSALLDQALISGRLRPGFSNADLNRVLGSHIPAGDAVYMQKEVRPDTGQVIFTPILLKKDVLMTGEAVRSAHMAIGGQYNQPYVSFSFNPRGARAFERITRENVGQRLAIILDNVVQSAPVIREPISGGQAQISGSFTPQEAGDLAIVLRAGALPAPVDIVQNLTIGPSLGRDSIRSGVAATIVGALLVIAFMAFYYRVSGAIADLALVLNLIYMLAALSIFKATLTLPGIAGIVLSTGMAVDSNVLIFERMREELGPGRPLRSVVFKGYDKAWWTIIDAHVTTLITAFALFLFGTGPIKGFAVTLSIGVIFNLFTALSGTKIIYEYLLFKRYLQKLHFLHILHGTRIDFIRLRKPAFVLSGMLVALGLFAFLQIQLGRANLGVDFTGGTLVQFQAQKPFALEPIRAALQRHHLSDYELQEVPHQNILIVRAKRAPSASSSVADQMAALLAQEFADNPFHLQSKVEIGAAVSSDLKKAALIAIIISMMGVIIYLALRFDVRFGTAAAIATFHDVLTVLGVFYLLHKEISLLVVTALLTLAGYSLTDTVVVFDRIRENLRLKKGLDGGTIINESINEVLSRTIITSGTVLIVLAALLWLGGPLLHDFALALTIGVIVGTYSSVFVASPIVYIWPGSGSILGKGRK